jgi:hypothetical protein
MALVMSENTAKLPLKRFAMKQGNAFASMGAIAILIIRTFAIMPLCHYAIMPLYHYAIIPLCHYAIMPLYHYTTSASIAFHNEILTHVSFFLLSVPIMPFLVSVQMDVRFPCRVLQSAIYRHMPFRLTHILLCFVYV